MYLPTTTLELLTVHMVAQRRNDSPKDTTPSFGSSRPVVACMSLS